MSKLNAIKTLLLGLKEVEVYVVHERELGDAIQEDRRQWQFNPPDDNAPIVDMRILTLEQWCDLHGVRIQTNPVSDHIEFTRKEER